MSGPPAFGGSAAPAGPAVTSPTASATRAVPSERWRRFIGRPPSGRESIGRLLPELHVVESPDAREVDLHRLGARGNPEVHAQGLHLAALERASGEAVGADDRVGRPGLVVEHVAPGDGELDRRWLRLVRIDLKKTHLK